MVVIPACLPAGRRKLESMLIILVKNWIPAFAGMTEKSFSTVSYCNVKELLLFILSKIADICIYVN